MVCQYLVDIAHVYLPNKDHWTRIYFHFCIKRALDLQQKHFKGKGTPQLSQYKHYVPMANSSVTFA